MTTLNLQRAEQAIDLSLVAHMSNLREVLAPAATVPIAHKEALAKVPTLREVVLTQGSFTAADLPLLVGSSSLTRLHLNRMQLTGDAVVALSQAPKLKQLRLHQVDGVSASDLAELPAITQLGISEAIDSDYAALSDMARLRTLQIEGAPLSNLDFFASRKLVSFTADHLAADESGLALLPSGKQLHTFAYPVSDLSVLADCSKLSSLRLNGSAPLDFGVVAHLPVTGIQVYYAPDKHTAEAILAEAKKTWPGLRMTGYRQDWDAPAKAEVAAKGSPSSDVPEGHDSRGGLLTRLFGARGRSGRPRG